MTESELNKEIKDQEVAPVYIKKAQFCSSCQSFRTFWVITRTWDDYCKTEWVCHQCGEHSYEGMPYDSENIMVFGDLWIEKPHPLFT